MTLERIPCTNCGKPLAVVNLPGACPSCGKWQAVLDPNDAPATTTGRLDSFAVEVDGVPLDPFQVQSKLASARIRQAQLNTPWREAKAALVKAEAELTTAKKQIKEDVARAERINQTTGKSEKVYSNDLLREAEVNRRLAEGYARLIADVQDLEAAETAISVQSEDLHDEISLYKDLLKFQMVLLERDTAMLQADSIGQYASTQLMFVREGYDAVSGEMVPEERSA